MHANKIKNTKMTKPKSKDLEHTDKRTGIVYTNVSIQTTQQQQQQQQQQPQQSQPYIDAFISSSFLKHYFGNDDKSI